MSPESRPTSIICRDGERRTFRSRIEARWAMYFDRCGFKWEYEPFKFSLNRRGTYTPDFAVDEIGIIEVKPTFRMLGESIERIEEYVARSGNRVHVFFGPVPLDSGVAIVGGNPARLITCDIMQSILILCGKQRRLLALHDFPAVQDSVRTSLLSASAGFAKEAMSVGELLTLAKHSRQEPSEFTPGARALQRMIEHGATV